MYKFLISSLCLSLLLSVTVLGQTKLDDYKSSYFGKSYDIDVAQDKKNKNKYTYYIACESADRLIDNVCLRLESKEVGNFIEYLNNIKETYAKWRQTAIDNNVNELDKTIEVKKFVASGAFYYGSEWKFDFAVPLKAYVKFTEENKVLVVRSDELEASSNQFMDHDGFYLVFTHPDEVDDFIKKIQLEKVVKFFDEKNKKDDLFKN